MGNELLEHIARGMGMKPHREVLEVVKAGDGYKVRTHDGQWTLVDGDGNVIREAPEPATDEAGAKTAAKRQARG